MPGLEDDRLGEIASDLIQEGLGVLIEHATAALVPRKGRRVDEKNRSAPRGPHGGHDAGGTGAGNNSIVVGEKRLRQLYLPTSEIPCRRHDSCCSGHCCAARACVPRQQRDASSRGFETCIISTERSDWRIDGEVLGDNGVVTRRCRRNARITRSSTTQCPTKCAFAKCEPATQKMTTDPELIFYRRSIVSRPSRKSASTASSSSAMDRGCPSPSSRAWSFV